MAEVNAPDLLPTRLRVNFLLYDPYTQRRYDEGQQVDNVLLDGWVQSQLDAGFLVRV